MSALRVVVRADDGRFKQLWLYKATRLERLVQRRLPHPQSTHLTSEELERLTPQDHVRIARAAERRRDKARTR